MKKIIGFLLSFTTVLNGFSQTSNGNAFLIGNHVEVGIAGPGGFEGADLNVGTLPGVHWRSDLGNDLLGFVADPTLSGWVNFDGDFFTPGSPENGWGFQIGTAIGGNNGMGDLDIPGAVTNWSNTNGCIQVDWSGSNTNSGYDLSFDLVYKLNENELFYSTEVTVTNNSSSTINDFYYYRNIDPDNNEVLNGDYSTQNTIVSQPTVACSKALVSATQSTPWLSYLGIAAIGENFRVSHGGFSNRSAIDLWNGTGFNSAVGSSINADEAISLSYYIPTLGPGESKTFKFLIILDAAQADNAINNLFFFNYQGSLGGPIPECSPEQDTAFTCTSMPIDIQVDGNGFTDFNWEWSPSTGLTDTVGLQTSANPQVTTTYTVTGTPLSSCYNGSITKDITVDVILGPDVTYVDPGTQCNTFDLNDLVYNDVNGIAGTISGFYSSPPATADDTSGLMTSTIISEGDSVWVVVADTLRGCVDYELVDINWSPGFLLDIAITDANCGVNNGSADVIGVNGGATPYNYQWLGGPATSNYDSLGFGSYTVTVTDSLGCSVDSTINIIDLTSLSGTVDNIIKTECGLANGSIEVSGVAGAPAYIYDIGSGAQASGVFNGLLPGSYDITVSDQDGCNYLLSNIIVGDTSTLSGVVLNIDEAECGLADGEVQVEGVDGALGYGYDIGSGTQSTGDFTGLAAGSYTVTISDAGGCTFDLPLIVGDTNTLALNLITLTDEGCGNSTGVIEVEGVGGASPYQYNIGGLNQASGLFTGLSAGNYTVTIIGNGGCTVDSVFTLINVNQTIDKAILSIVDENCGMSNGSFEVEASNSVAPYQYNIGGVNQTSGLFENLPSGNYTINISDANGCTTDTTVTITSIPLTLNLGSDVIECEDVVLTMPAGGTYLWSTGEETQSITISTTGTYWGQVSGGGACLASDTITITRLEGSDIVVPNVFSPNGDEMNDGFGVSGTFIDNYSILIFNRWGKKVFESSDIDAPWDGENSNAGTYFYIIEYDDPCLNGEKQIKKGTLQLFK